MMTKASYVLDRLICQMGLEPSLKLLMIQKKWVEFFERNLLAHMYPSDLRDGVLIINVDSPLWLRELSYLKENILDRLKYLDIRDLKFRIGRIYPFQSEDKAVRQYQPCSEDSDPVPDFLVDDLLEIKDKELRANIVSIANKIKKLQSSGA